MLAAEKFGYGACRVENQGEQNSTTEYKESFVTGRIGLLVKSLPRLCAMSRDDEDGVSLCTVDTCSGHPWTLWEGLG